jgi:hypothetical protein
VNGLALSDGARSTAGILRLTVVAVEYGGWVVLRIVRGHEPATECQATFARAGHAHAAMLVTLALVTQLFVEAADRAGCTRWVASTGVWLAAVLFPPVRVNSEWAVTGPLRCLDGARSVPAEVPGASPAATPAQWGRRLASAAPPLTVRTLLERWRSSALDGRLREGGGVSASRMRPSGEKRQRVDGPSDGQPRPEVARRRPRGWGLSRAAPHDRPVRMLGLAPAPRRTEAAASARVWPWSAPQVSEAVGKGSAVVVAGSSDGRAQ